MVSTLASSGMNCAFVRLCGKWARALCGSAEPIGHLQLPQRSAHERRATGHGAISGVQILEMGSHLGEVLERLRIYVLTFGYVTHAAVVVECEIAAHGFPDDLLVEIA